MSRKQMVGWCLRGLVQVASITWFALYREDWSAWQTFLDNASWWWYAYLGNPAFWEDWRSLCRT